jgi:predicted protein tyrosine phosphatase
MARLHVCSLALLEETVAAAGADHVLTVISAGADVPRPAAIAPQRHLFLAVSDIVAAHEGSILANEGHIAQALDFVRGWDQRRAMVVHCYAGVSRSTATAFIAACALRPDLDEARIAGAIRLRSPTATPNPLFVALADRMLGRDGRMIAAVEAIGRGAECYEGAPFHLDLGPGGP